MFYLQLFGLIVYMKKKIETDSLKNSQNGVSITIFTKFVLIALNIQTITQTEIQ